MKMSIAVVVSALSFGEKKLAKCARVATTSCLGRSALIKAAHFLERIGLAMVGGAGGLYVAVGLVRMITQLFLQKWRRLDAAFYRDERDYALAF